MILSVAGGSETGCGTEIARFLRNMWRNMNAETQMRGRSADEPDATCGPEEVRKNKGSGGIVREGDARCQTDKTPGQRAKAKAKGGKGEHGSKGGTGSKGTHQVSNMIEEDRRENVRKLVKMVQEEEAQEGPRGRSRREEVGGVEGKIKWTSGDVERDERGARSSTATTFSILFHCRICLMICYTSVFHVHFLAVFLWFVHFSIIFRSTC